MVTAFGEQLDASVRHQLIADVPVGVLLSGGLDSAVLAATVARVGAAPPCFTVGFDSTDGRSETADAAETARLLGLPHHPLNLSETDLIDVEERVLDHLEEPLGTTSALAMWHLCRLARSRVTVALAGQGADEPLGGYRRHRLEALRSSLPAATRPLLRALLGALPAHLGGELGRAARVAATGPWLHAHVAARQVFSLPEVQAICGACASPVEAMLAARLEGVFAPEAGRSDLARSLWLDARTQLSDDLLLYGDKISMAHSLEVRVPYLGAGLLAFMESLPDQCRVDALQGKRILRAWARRIVPEAIIRRRKRGFLIPNLFRNRRFREDSIARACASLGRDGHGLNWDVDWIVGVLAGGTRGGAAEVRAWTLHSLARWIELHGSLAAARDATLDGGRHDADALRTKDDTTV
jgi:asparagine synthase (glutamine-hydrolysing)